MVLSNHSSVCFVTKAFWVLPFLFFLLLKKSLCGAQVGELWRHSCIAYFSKSNNGSMEKNIIQSNQDVQVCGYKVAILILLCSLKHISLFIETLKKPFVRTWAIETMDFFYILAKENSPSTLNRKGWISMPKPYLTSQQLRQYVFPICFFPQALRIWKEQNLCSPYLKSYIQIYFQILNLSVDFGSF